MRGSTRARGRRAALAAAVLAVVASALCSAAAAHEVGGGARSFYSQVTSVTPAAGAVAVEVLGRDDRLGLRLTGNHVLVVMGYDGEPYLRFTSSGVYRNTHSPAAYLNAVRIGTARVPASAHRGAAPAWVRVADGGRAYEWHDHRIHWMSSVLPPAVAAAKLSAHHVFDWDVPAQLDGVPLTIRGSLDYRPAVPSGSHTRSILAPLLAVATIVPLALFAYRRRSCAGARTVARMSA